MSIDRAKAMQVAQKYLAKGQVDKAIAEYERVVQSDPKDARTLLKLGDLYTRKGANKEASATYRKVAEQYAEQGFFLKAVAVCKQILKLDPGQLEVWEKLAEMYELLSLVSDALTTYEQVADAHARAGNPRKALRALEKTAELDPENVATRIRYAEALSKLNKADEAAVAFAQGAELLKKQGRIDDYLKVAERLLFHQPDNYELCRELAAAYLQRNDAKHALSKLQVCFNVDPKNVDTLKLLARAFEQLGQVQKTVAVLKEVARIHATEARRADQGSVLRKILTLDPGDTEVRRELSQLGGSVTSGPHTVPLDVSDLDYEEILVDDDEAPTARRSGASLRPSSPEAELRRGQIARLLSECDVFLRYGLFDKMIAQLQKVLDLEPSNLEARAKLKEVYLRTNKPAEAVMQLIMIAESLAGTDPAAAREHLREATKLDPKNRAVADRLQALEASAEEEDEVIVLDDHDEAEAPDLSDVTLTDSLAAKEKPEESFASVIPSDDKLAEEDEGPELIMEDAAEGGEELDLEAGEAAADDEPTKPAEAEALPEEIGEALGEVEFYLKQGLTDEARETLQDALGSYPDHPALLERLAAIDAAEGGAEDTSFALAQKLAGESKAEQPASGTSPVDVADVLAHFKAGVAKQIDKNDTATHYDLGIAYMEMGLHLEAIDEFRLCLHEGGDRVCRAHTMIGLSYVAKGDMEPGIEHFKQALESRPNDDEEIGLWFEIGNAHELLGRNMEALVWYEKVEEKNPAFRDVAQRIERLGIARTPEQEADDFDEMFDSMIVKE